MRPIAETEVAQRTQLSPQQLGYLQEAYLQQALSQIPPQATITEIQRVPTPLPTYYWTEQQIEKGLGIIISPDLPPEAVITGYQRTDAGYEIKYLERPYTYQITYEVPSEQPSAKKKESYVAPSWGAWFRSGLEGVASTFQEIARYHDPMKTILPPSAKQYLVEKGVIPTKPATVLYTERLEGLQEWILGAPMEEGITFELVAPTTARLPYYSAPIPVYKKGHPLTPIARQVEWAYFPVGILKTVESIYRPEVKTLAGALVSTGVSYIPTVKIGRHTLFGEEPTTAPITQWAEETARHPTLFFGEIAGEYLLAKYVWGPAVQKAWKGVKWVGVKVKTLIFGKQVTPIRYVGGYPDVKSWKPLPPSYPETGWGIPKATTKHYLFDISRKGGKKTVGLYFGKGKPITAFETTLTKAIESPERIVRGGRQLLVTETLVKSVRQVTAQKTLALAKAKTLWTAKQITQYMKPVTQAVTKTVEIAKPLQHPFLWLGPKFPSLVKTKRPEQKFKLYPLEKVLKLEVELPKALIRQIDLTRQKETLEKDLKRLDETLKSRLELERKKKQREKQEQWAVPIARLQLQLGQIPLMGHATMQMQMQVQVQRQVTVKPPKLTLDIPAPKIPIRFPTPTPRKREKEEETRKRMMGFLDLGEKWFEKVHPIPEPEEMMRRFGF